MRRGDRPLLRAVRLGCDAPVGSIGDIIALDLIRPGERHQSVAVPRLLCPQKADPHVVVAATGDVAWRQCVPADFVERQNMRLLGAL